ncbi:hypothetical protein ACFFS2_30485 [Streptomyces aurantiacus]|uniref:Uncharacterized protein n=1 Tax=Streptomyces aurantiacus TaxID=47760 RepID=A0A7G1NZJ1_9ACTN|nr:hypothetical protein [Streptomyces aurantiacus]BCL28568.1 hypothetical protein GCM10017557_34270 [Streptomyces aurantiacus]
MPSNAYNLEQAKRQPLTKKNLRELNIQQAVQSILNQPGLVHVDDYGVRHKPVGFSLNKVGFGRYTGSLAFDLGWLAYMNLGEPLIEERRNISQPPPDTFSSRTYVNRSEKSEMDFTDSVNFTVSNGVTWSLQGDTKLTFGGDVSAQLQLQLQLQLGLNLQAQLQAQLKNEITGKSSNTMTSKNSPESTGMDNANAVDMGTTNGVTNTASGSVTGSTSFTTTGSASGSAGLDASLAQGVAASVDGSLTTGWASTSQISGKVPAGSRVETLVTQRRTHKQYTYEIPVTFSGLLAVEYKVPVPVLSPPQQGDYPGLSRWVARDIGDIGLTDGGFRMKGLAEVVSALEVHHTMFDSESLTDSRRALYKKP